MTSSCAPLCEYWPRCGTWSIAVIDRSDVWDGVMTCDKCDKPKRDVEARGFDHSTPAVAYARRRSELGTPCDVWDALGETIYTNEMAAEDAAAAVHVAAAERDDAARRVIYGHDYADGLRDDLRKYPQDMWPAITERKFPLRFPA